MRGAVAAADAELLLKKVKRTKLHATNQNQIQGRRAFFKSTDPM